MFFRGSGLSTGNGLGLYLVQKAAEIVKGEIKFKSQHRETTEFIVRIPVDSYHPIQENAKEEAISKLFEDKI